jgi:hypothetical protein
MATNMPSSRPDMATTASLVVLVAGSADDAEGEGLVVAVVGAEARMSGVPFRVPAPAAGRLLVDRRQLYAD